MGDPHDEHLQLLIAHLVDHPVLTHTNLIQVSRSGELPDTVRPRIAGERLEGGDDGGLHLLGQITYLATHRRLDLDVIHQSLRLQAQLGLQVRQGDTPVLGEGSTRLLDINPILALLF